MYRGTERFAAYHKRVASSSTKGRAGGLVETLPPDARPWEQLFHTFREQHALVLNKLTAAQVRLGIAYDRASGDFSEDELTQIAKDVQQARRDIAHYREAAEEFEAAAADAARNGVGFCFIAAAKHALLDEQFASLMHTAHEMARGTGLGNKLPELPLDPVCHVPHRRMRHLAYLSGDAQPSPQKIASVERPPKVVLKRKGRVIDEPKPEVNTTLAVAWTKAMRHAREAAVRALLRNETSPKRQRAAGSHR